MEKEGTNEALTEESILATGWQKICVRTLNLENANAAFMDLVLLPKENVIRDSANVVNQVERNNELSYRQVRADLSHQNHEVQNVSTQESFVTPAVPVTRETEELQPAEN